MATRATTLTAAAAAANYPALSLRQVMENFLVAIQTNPVNATTLTATAAAQNYPSLSDRELQEAILAALAGGGGSGVGPPTGTAVNGQTYLDTNTGNFYIYWNGWQFSGITLP